MGCRLLVTDFYPSFGIPPSGGGFLRLGCSEHTVSTPRMSEDCPRRRESMRPLHAFPPRHGPNQLEELAGAY